MMTLYNILVSCVTWVIVVPWHVILISIGKSSHKELNQHLGRAKVPQKDGRLRVLIHAVSAGEMAAAEPLLRELLTNETASIEFILTTGNKDGMSLALKLQARYTGIISVQLLPWDIKRPILVWLGRIQPDLVVILETELWPSFFLACKKLDIPLYIANGRIYPVDAGRYAFARRFFKQVLCCAEWIGVQNEGEQQRFIRIGAAPADVHVVGNMKYDVPIQLHNTTDKRLTQLERAGMVIVAGSTHHPEERWVLDSFRQLRQTQPSVHLVLAPRHVTRSDSLIRMAEQRGMKTILWSTGENASGEWDVLVLDEMGWLPSVYKHASVAVIGGSFVNHGGHNLLEAAVQGCAIVIGPHVQHFQDSVEEFDNAEGIVWLRTHLQLTTSLLELFADPDRRASLGNNARKLLDSKRGAARSYADALRSRLDINNPAETSRRCIPTTSST